MDDGVDAYRRIDFLETQERSKTLKNECDQDIQRDVVEKDKLIDTLNELENDLLAFKTENNLLRENNKDLEFDNKKLKGDYLELSKKVASQYYEYQEKIKELSVERTAIEKRNLKKEEKRAKKKANKEQKARDSEIVTEVE